MTDLSVDNVPRVMQQRLRNMRWHFYPS